MSDYTASLNEFNRIKGYFTGDKNIAAYFLAHFNSATVSEVRIKLNECINHSENRFNLSDLSAYILKLNLDTLLRSGDLSAVQKICEFKNSGFGICQIASRYCNWHNAHAYAICSEYAYQFLYNKMPTENTEVSYVRFTKDIARKRKEMNLEELNYMEFDKFLWLFKPGMQG
ncbi:MAG: hypothetical protein RLO81_20180 [Fulvivirga sp.]|uniref:hypothetical protein n=1 Tax=Fulvivirga sp. TaxID=1931237 RepID=UPI0032F06EE3